MPITRADSFTTEKKKQKYFSDFHNSFVKTPYGNDLARLTNERASNQLLKNLILTNRGEVPFEPWIGSDVNRSLFELNGPVETAALESYIQTTIENCAKHIQLVRALVEEVPNRNELKVSIYYYLINNTELITLDFILKRVR